MRTLTSSWSNTLRKLGLRAQKKSRHVARYGRRPSLESLEERINFSTGIIWMWQTMVDKRSCGCDCSPVKKTTNNGATTNADKMSYGSSGDPVVSLQFQLIDEADDLNDETSAQAEFTIGGGGSTSVYWAGGGGTDVYPVNGPSGEFRGMFSVQFDASALSSGVYNWSVDFDGQGGGYSQDQDSTGHYLHVVNRTNSPFGDGWSLPGLDQLIVQDGLTDRPDGVALLMSDDALVWFGIPTDDGNGHTTYSREDNPYNFGILQKDISAGTYTLTDPDGTVHNFNSSGLLTSVVDRNGNELDGYSYGSGSRLSSITDEAGRVTHFAYNSNNLVSEITDFYSTGGAQTTNYDYTFSGSDVVQMRMSEPDPDGTGPLSRPLTTYNYDNGKLSSVIDPRGLKSDITYDSVGLVHEIVQSCGGPITVKTQESQTAGSVTDSGASNPGLIALNSPEAFADATAESPNGFEVVDQYGEVTISARGRYGSFSDQFNNIFAQKDAEGNVTLYAYYGNGLLYQVLQPASDPNYPFAELTTYYYNTDANSQINGQTTEIDHPIGSEHWSYDTFGTNNQISAVISYTDANSNTTYYDRGSESGNINSMRQWTGSEWLTTEYTYTDGLGDTPIKGLTETVTDPNPNDHVTHYFYNTQGLVTDVTSAENTGDVTTTHYEYDERDRVSSMTDGNCNTTVYEYDNLDQLVQQTDPDPIQNDEYGLGEIPVWHYQYDQNGNQTHVINPVGTDTEYVYDVRNRVIQVIQPVPIGTPSVTTKDDSQGTFNAGTWSQITRSGSVNGDVYATSANGGEATYTFTGLDADKKYAVAIRWVPSSTPTDYDTNALFEVYGNTGADPLNKMRANLNSKPQGKPDGSGLMWLSLGAFSAYSNTLTVKLRDDDNNGKLVIDAVRLVEVGSVSETDYDCNGNLIKTIDPLNHVTEYEYDELNRLITRTDPDPDGGGDLPKPVTHYFYNALGWLTTTTDPDGNVTSYQYNAMGRQTKEMKPSGAGLYGEYFDGAGFDPGSFLFGGPGVENLDFEPFSGLMPSFSARWSGRIYIDPSDIDETGNLTFFLDSTDHTQLYIDDQLIVDNYNSSGRKEESGDATLIAGWHTLNVTFECTDDDTPNDLVLSYDIGAGEEVIPANVLFSAGPTTTETYDDAGNLKTLTDSNGYTTSWNYDGVNRLTDESVVIDSETLTRTYKYDGVGNVIQKTDRNGRVTTYEYDALNRPKAEKWYSDQTALDNYPELPLDTFEYTYDANSNLVSADDDYSYLFFSYDGLNRQAGEGSFQRQFDAAGRVTDVTAGDVPFLYTNHYTYDNLGRMTTVVQSSTDGGSFWWDDPVAPKRVDFTYDAAGKITDIARYASETTSNPVATSAYVHDGLGRATSIAHTHTASGSTYAEEYDYEYDDASQLIHSTGLIGSIDKTYEYDTTGQLVTVGATSLLGSEGYYDRDLNGNPSDGDPVVGDRIRHGGSYTYTYDAEGNRTGAFVDNDLDGEWDSDESGMMYTWDHRNRLTNVSFINTSGQTTKLIDYKYDAFNQLIDRSVDPDGETGSAAVGETGFAYERGQVALQFDKVSGTMQLSHRYLWGPAVDQLLADEQTAGESSAGDTYWAMTDSQGTVRDVLDSNGKLRIHKQFDSFGNVLGETHYNSSGSTVTSGTGFIDEAFAYTGRWFDKATGLQNNLSRWYDPVVGRFLSEDPIGFAGGDTNLYRYVGNSPTNFSDPRGLQWGARPWPDPSGYHPAPKRTKPRRPFCEANNLPRALPCKKSNWQAGGYTSVLDCAYALLGDANKPVWPILVGGGIISIFSFPVSAGLGVGGTVQAMGAVWWCDQCSER